MDVYWLRKLKSALLKYRYASTGLGMQYERPSTSSYRTDPVDAFFR